MFGAAGVAAMVAAPAFAEPVQDGTWSDHALWPVLKKTKLTTDANGLVKAAFAPEVMALGGKPMTITGFVLPIAANSRTHYILSRYSPECPFCPSGGPNEVIEVFLKKPLGPTSAMVTMHGLFSMQPDMDAGLFYRMKDAALA
jgi:hypothetical protein